MNGMTSKATKFLQEVREELRKVSWPTREETIRLTAVVIGVSAVVGIYLAALDFVLQKMVKMAIGG
jgi:preprotein translocase subunit SecE